jgi:23S rRNA (adenine2503-C2)-methyltransferase
MPNPLSTDLTSKRQPIQPFDAADAVEALAPLAAAGAAEPVEAVIDGPELAPHLVPDLATQAGRAKTTNFYVHTLAELEAMLVGLGKEKFRALQAFKWVYEKRVEDFAQMTNVARAFRAELPGIFHFAQPRKASELKSRDGTRKWLFDVGEGMTVETVLIPNGERLTLCVSSEVGCNIACRFCYTGKQKLKRRLAAEEIVGQFLQAQDSLAKDGLRVTNLVFMGMGEPLDNADAVFKAIEILHTEGGVNFSRRKVTVSTSGIVPLIPRVTEAGVRLAVSLNAPNDAIRDYVMPINRRWKMAELLAACRAHAEASGDRVTFEYVLLRGATDQLEHARELYQATKGVPCKINLIPFNEHPGSGFERPSAEAVARFQAELMRLGAHVLLRKTMGRDIFAACGQLTSVYRGRPETMTL